MGENAAKGVGVRSELFVVWRCLVGIIRVIVRKTASVCGRLLLLGMPCRLSDAGISSTPFIRPEYCVFIR